jgi:hypothetical protein
MKLCVNKTLFTKTDSGLQLVELCSNADQWKNHTSVRNEVSGGPFARHLSLAALLSACGCGGT